MRGHFVPQNEIPAHRSSLSFFFDFRGRFQSVWSFVVIHGHLWLFVVIGCLLGWIGA